MKNMTDSTITPSFLLCVDQDNNELYILHRLWPACLIKVIQTTPVTFRIVDLYDDMEGNTQILADMPFMEKAKEFYLHQVDRGMGRN